MNHIDKMREKDGLVKQLQGMLARAEAEKRGLNETERSTYKTIEATVDRLSNEILDMQDDLERRRKLAEREIRGRVGNRRPGTDLPNVDPDKEFRNIGEMFWSIAAEHFDHRRDARLDAMREERAQSMGTGTEGGFALPTQFRDEILQVLPQEAIVRRRATVIAAGEPPDAKLDIPAIDQTSSKNIYGGVEIVHTGENITMTETSAALRQVTLEPHELSAYIITSNKLLNNWSAASAVLTTQLRRAMNGQEDYDFMRGSGINCAMGFLNSPAGITVARSGAGLVAFADVVGMFTRLRLGGSPVWVCSQTIIPQLTTMVDSGGHAIWLGGRGDGGAGAAGTMPGNLFGMPVLFADRLPALGTSGDINLVDLQYYLVKDGSGPFAAISTELLFLSNRTIFKLVWSVDGRPWLTEPIGLEGSTANTVSPFVKLS